MSGTVPISGLSISKCGELGIFFFSSAVPAIKPNIPSLPVTTSGALRSANSVDVPSRARMSARASTSGPASLLRTLLMCMPGSSHSALMTGTRESVVSDTTSAPRSAFSGASTGTTSTSSFCVISAAKASRFFFCRAENTHRFDRPHLLDRFCISSRHSPRADHREHFGILARKIFRADSGAGADAHVLQIAVVHQRQRLVIALTEKKNQAAVTAALHAILVFDHKAVLVLPGEHVRFHADREHAELT